jgi:hypothetical protein
MKIGQANTPKEKNMNNFSSTRQFGRKVARCFSREMKRFVRRRKIKELRSLKRVEKDEVKK